MCVRSVSLVAFLGLKPLLVMAGVAKGREECSLVRPLGLGVCGEVLAARGLQGWPLCEETRGCPVLATAGASRLCNGPSSACQRGWGHLWDNVQRRPRG